MFKRIYFALAMLLALVPVEASAQERSAVVPGFTLAANRQVKVVVFRPDVTVGSMTTGGVQEPNAEWTETARGYMEQSLSRSGLAGAANVVFVNEDPQGDQGKLLADYRSLFRAVADSVVAHKLFVGNRLPTKKEAFDWSLGSGAAELGNIAGGADYALFFYTEDAYGTAGRKAAQLFAAALLGVYVQPGIHVGYAGLIDLKTGNLMWFNADPQMGGDVRTPDGADKRVGQLLDGLPGLAPTAAATAAK
jgi:hypothetical protein